MCATIRSTASPTGMPLSWEPSRKRKDTAPASASSPPAMSTNGTFSLEAVRIFFGNRSDPASSSARTPRARRASTTSRR